MVAPNALQRCLLSFLNDQGASSEDSFAATTFDLDISIWIEMIADVENMT